MRLLVRIKRRRWCQFGITTVLFLMTMIGAALARVTNSARAQARIVRAIHRIGGECRYSHQYSRSPEYLGEIDLTAKPRWPGWALDRLGIDFFENVVVVVLRGQLHPEVIRSLAELEGLEELYIVKSELLPSDVRDLSRLSKVRVLFLQLETSADYHLFRELPQRYVIPMVLKSPPKDSGG